MVIMSRKFRSLNQQNNEFLLRLVIIVAVLVLLVIAVCAFKVISAKREGIPSSLDVTEEISNPDIVETADIAEIVPEEETVDAGGLSDFAEEEESGNEIPVYDTFIFVGDSRFVAMSACANEQDSFLCETGESFYFLKSHYNEIRRMESYESGNNCAMVIGLGVNNLTQAEDYIDFLNNYSFDSDIYFLTVNPVESGKEYKVSDDAIRAFNAKMAENQGVYTQIDTYDKLVEHGYSTQDGVHYYDATTEYLYQLIKSYFGYNEGHEPYW